MEYSLLQVVILFIERGYSHIYALYKAHDFNQKGIFDEITYLICKSGDSTIELGRCRDLLLGTSFGDAIAQIALEHHIDLSGEGEYK